MMTVDARAKAAQNRDAASPGRGVRRNPRACLECGGASGSKGDFCSRACKDTFGNRRKRRGAELYDLYMAHRWDRLTARQMGVLQAMNRLASDFRDEDRREREGRRSWRKPAEVLAERPYLKSVRMRVRAGR